MRPIIKSKVQLINIWKHNEGDRLNRLHTHTQKRRRYQHGSVSNTSLSFSPSSTPSHPSLLPAASRPPVIHFWLPLSQIFSLYPFHLYFSRSPALRFVSLFESCKDSRLPPRGDVVGVSTQLEMLFPHWHCHLLDNTHTHMREHTLRSGEWQLSQTLRVTEIASTSRLHSNDEHFFTQTRRKLRTGAVIDFVCVCVLLCVEGEGLEMDTSWRAESSTISVCVNPYNSSHIGICLRRPGDYNHDMEFIIAIIRSLV